MIKSLHVLEEEIGVPIETGLIGYAVINKKPSKTRKLKSVIVNSTD